MAHRDILRCRRLGRSRSFLHHDRRVMGTRPSPNEEERYSFGLGLSVLCTIEQHSDAGNADSYFNNRPGLVSEIWK